MPPRKRAPAGPPPLTDADIASLKPRVSAGERPRVIVRAASAAVPAGTRGNIVRLGNPADGEYVVVRLGRDEVPFAPSELAIATRGHQTAQEALAKAAKASKAAKPAGRAKAAASAPARTTKAAAKRPAGRTEPAKATRGRPTTRAATESAAPATEPTSAAATAPGARGRGARAGRSTTGRAAASATTAGAAAPATPDRAGTSTTSTTAGRAGTSSRAAASAAPARSAARTTGSGRGRTGTRRAGSRTRQQSLVVTLRFSDDTWTVEAQRGARRLARASQVRPGAVKAFADLVDDDLVRDAITETIDSSRAVVEERAAALRAELEAAESALREYEARRR